MPEFRVWFPPPPALLAAQSPTTPEVRHVQRDSLLSTGFPVHDQPQPRLWLCPALISPLSELFSVSALPHHPMDLCSRHCVLLLMACPVLGSGGCAQSPGQAMLLVSCCISWLLMAAQLRSYEIHILPA